MIWYKIHINGVEYVPMNMVDSNAKIMWGKADNGLVYKKWIDGSFTLTRSNNEALYDAIMAMTFCYNGGIEAYTEKGDFIVRSIFRKIDVEYDTDRCQVTFKPRYYESANSCIGKNGDKDYNIINNLYPVYTVQYEENAQYEFRVCETTQLSMGAASWNGTVWSGLGTTFPTHPSLCPDMWSYPYDLETGWTFYQQVNTNLNIQPNGQYNADVTTTYFRQVKLVPIIDGGTVNPPPSDGSAFDWILAGTVTINGYDYNKWVRCVENVVLDPTGKTYPDVIYWHILSYGYAPRMLNRVRKLNDVLTYFANNCGCDFVSRFFTESTNPVSGADLSNLMICQKSDAIYVGSPLIENSDPATIGNITFNQLMNNLQSIFNVYWYINSNNELVVEHINYFRNNLQYVVNTTVGIDLTAIYPQCLYFTNKYSYESSIPIREKFNFMEAWNLDFRGVDIDYTNCLTEGDTLTHSADQFTTDIDPLYLDTEASKDGFCLFHCDSTNNVISEVGELSGLELVNNHLSWANLHKNYWIYDRPISSGHMNNELTNFFMNKKLITQIQIQFPFCPADFDPNLLVRTRLGDGEVKTAEYSMKTRNLLIELIYE